MVCSAHPAQAALLLYAPRLASLSWVVCLFVVGLALFAWCRCWSLWLLAVLLVGSVSGLLRWLVGCLAVGLVVGWLRA